MNNQNDLVQLRGAAPLAEDTKKTNQEQLDSELAALQNARNVLQTITDNRKKAVGKLAKIVNRLDSSEKIHPDHLSPAHMEIVRDIRRGLSETLNGLDAHDTLLDMITNDLVGILDNLERHMESTQKNAILLQSVVTMLLDKQVVTGENLRDAQVKVITELRASMEKREKKPVTP